MRGAPCIRWSPFELAQLRRFAAERKTSFEIAQAMGGRSPSAVRTRAFMLGIKLAKPSMGRVPRDPDISTWTKADKISEWAQVPQPLAEMLVERAALAGYDLKQLRSEARSKPFVNFRKSFASDARRLGYSLPAIGRALNRDHTTIIYAIRSTESAFSCGKVEPVISSVSPAEGKIAA
jgi:hypothetical protein